MKKMVAMAISTLLLAACAGPGGAPPPLGASAAELHSRLGRPSASYRDGDATLLEYATGPSGQATYMARLDAAGRLLSYEQVLTSEKFATVKIGRDNRDSILHTFGQPFARQHYRAQPSGGLAVPLQGTGRVELDHVCAIQPRRQREQPAERAGPGARAAPFPVVAAGTGAADTAKQDRADGRAWRIDKPARPIPLAHGGNMAALLALQ